MTKGYIYKYTCHKYYALNMNNGMTCKKNIYIGGKYGNNNIGIKMCHIIHKSNFCVFCIIRVWSPEMAL